MDYRYPHFRRRLVMEDLSFKTGPGPGQPFPDFDLPTTDGMRLTKQDLLAGKPVLLTMGSFTCPMTADSGPPLKRLHERYNDRVAFLTLYVREAHPGDRYPQPETMEQKVEYARRYRERDGIPWSVLVDSLEGQLHRTLDPKPNAAYLLGADGRVAYRLLWTNHERALEQAMREVLAGRTGQRHDRVVPMMRGVARMDEMPELSGPQARSDVRREAPPMYAMARLAGLMKRPRTT
jgi:hypothetical protein